MRPSTPREQPQIPDAIDRRQPPNRANANHRHGASKAFPECLISIRDQTEWSLVAASPARIIDFKEPGRGPLAPTDPLLWHWAVAQPPRPGRCLSAALGEAAEARRIAAEVPVGFQFAKVGPSHCRSSRQLTRLWNELRASLASGVELVAVAYADAAAAETLEVETILAAARELGFRYCLIDTFLKDGRSALERLGPERLAGISRWARQHAIWWALAGSLTLDAATTLAPLGIHPDCLGLRGTLCDEGRAGNLSAARISQCQRIWEVGGDG